MTSSTTDRRLGLTGGTAYKAPCVAATTASITLNGEQTIDGIACVTGDRVLVKNQSAGADNGIYVVDTGDWTRDLDSDGNSDLRRGTQVYITQGSTQGGAIFAITTADPLTIGTTSLTFSQVAGSGGGGGNVTAASTLVANQLVTGGGGSAVATLGSLGTTTTLLHGHASGAPTFGAVVEADITLADNTTNDASITKHGFLPKLPNSASVWLDGTGAFTTPGGAGTVTHTAGNLTANALVVGNAVADTKVLADLGTATKLLHGSVDASQVPTWAAVSLSADVTGTLPIANGGTAANNGADAILNLATPAGIHLSTGGTNFPGLPIDGSSVLGDFYTVYYLTDTSTASHGTPLRSQSFAEMVVQRRVDGNQYAEDGVSTANAFDDYGLIAIAEKTAHTTDTTTTSGVTAGAFVTRQGKFGDTAAILANASRGYYAGGVGGAVSLEWSTQLVTPGAAGAELTNCHGALGFVANGSSSTYAAGSRINGVQSEMWHGKGGAAFAADTMRVTASGGYADAEWTDVLVAMNARTGTIADDESRVYFRVNAAGRVHANAVLNTYATPQFSFISDTDTGMYHPAADVVGLSVAGGTAVVVLQAGNFYPGTALDLGFSTQQWGNIWGATVHAATLQNGAGSSVAVANIIKYISSAVSAPPPTNTGGLTPTAWAAIDTIAGIGGGPYYIPIYL